MVKAVVPYTVLKQRQQGLQNVHAALQCLLARHNSQDWLHCAPANCVLHEVEALIYIMMVHVI